MTVTLVSPINDFLRRSTPVIVDVTLTTQLLVLAEFDATYEVAYDDVDFSDPFESSTREVITDGFRYSFKRLRGWLSNFSLKLVADGVVTSLPFLLTSEESLTQTPNETDELGYGQDLSCSLDLTDRMDMVDPFSVEGITQAVIRRFDTPRGALIDDPDYGLDLKSYVNRGVTDTELRELSGRGKLECEKDPRIEEARVEVTFDSSVEMRVSIFIRPRDSRIGSFALVMRATSAEVLLEEMRKAA